MPITHPFVSGVADDIDNTLVQPSDWNDAHVYNLGDNIRGATLTVASNTASAASKQQADYLCDGTDDDVQIAAAIAALPAAGGSVLLTEGQFNVRKDLITPVSKMVLRGRGVDATTIKLQDAQHGRIITNPSSKDSVLFADMTLDGNGANQVAGANRDAHALMYLGLITKLGVDNMRFINCYAGASIRLGSCNDILIRNSWFKDAGTFGGAFTADHIYGGDSNLLQVYGCNIGNCTDTGVALEGVQFGVVSGNHILGPDAQAVSVSPSPSRVAAFLNIVGNMLGGALGTGSGVMLGHFNNPGTDLMIGIKSNSILSCGYGIILENGDGISIVGNDILADLAPAEAIHFMGGVDDVMIRANRIHAASVGVNFSAGAPTNVAIIGNDFRNTFTKITGSIPATARIKDNRGYNPQGPATISVTASPFTYTAGPTPETIYIFGGTVSTITKNSVEIATASPATVVLDAGEALSLAYTVAPTMVKDRQ